MEQSTPLTKQFKISFTNRQLVSLIGPLLLEQLRAFVELKSAFFGNGKDRGARLVGNVRLIVEHARNGPERIAAQSCQIFDRHSCLLPLG